MVYMIIYIRHVLQTRRMNRSEWVFRNLSSEYKVIFIGDASMAPSELMSKGGNNSVGLYNELPGIEWLMRFKRRYPKHIWLNPIPAREWEYVNGRRTIGIIRETFPMYELSIGGLEAGIKKLLVSK